MENYSVLMSVYYKEKPEFLRESIQSMLNQTVPTNDFVIVCDGPLTPELDTVLKQFNQDNPDLFQIIRLPKNVGIGAAANTGLKYCKNNLIAKMDSDDISRETRCEKQLEIFSEFPNLDILGGQLSEFEDSTDQIFAIRKVPLNQDEILIFAKRRMPFNNQTVMYKKKKVLEIGGYSPLRRCEDYDLFVRMLQGGCIAKNLPDVLVDYRLNKNAIQRRGMMKNFQGFVQVRWRMYMRGFSGLMDLILPCLGQLFISIVPNKLKIEFYKRCLR